MEEHTDISGRNSLRLVMTFSQSGHNPQIKLLPEELLEISQEINRDFAPSFSIKKQQPPFQHKLSPKEMLDISEEISQSFAPKASDNKQELVILPVDPDHLYAYWNLGNDEQKSAQKNDSGNQLTLRIYSEPQKTVAITTTKSWFDVNIKSAQAQQKIFLPSRTLEAAYSATIGKRYADNSLAPLASSNITHISFGKVMPHQVKESQTVLKTMPQLITTNREISTNTNSSASASGQGNNQ
jgi:uncharacterized protein